MLFIELTLFELKKALRSPAIFCEAVAFYFLSNLVFIFATNIVVATEQIYAFGICLTLFLFVALFNSEQFFKSDHKTGFLDQLLLIDPDLDSLLLSKYLAFLLINMLPLLVFTALLLFIYDVEPAAISYFSKLLALNLPLLTALIFFGASLTFRLESKNFLIFLLILPLLIPQIIFIMLQLENYLAGQSSDYFNFMIFVNLLLLPILFLLSKLSLKSTY